MWWNNPKPKLKTPKSGLFDNVTTRVERLARPQPGAIGQYSARRRSTSVEAEPVEVMAAWSDS